MLILGRRARKGFLTISVIALAIYVILYVKTNRATSRTHLRDLADNHVIYDVINNGKTVTKTNTEKNPLGDQRNKNLTTASKQSLAQKEKEKKKTPNSKGGKENVNNSVKPDAERIKESQKVNASVRSNAKDEVQGRNNDLSTKNKQKSKDGDSEPSSKDGARSKERSSTGPKVKSGNDPSQKVKVESSKSAKNKAITKTRTKDIDSSKAQPQLNISDDDCTATLNNLTLTPGRVSKGNSERYLIYKCDHDLKRGYCGGWADRQRGIISTYLLSLVTCRRFGIIMTSPCDVAKFFEPNGVNWTVPLEALRKKTSISLNDVGNRKNLTRRLRSGMDFNKEYPQQVVYLQTNSQEYVISLLVNERYSKYLPSWTREKRPVFFLTAWNLLMKPKQDLLSSVDRFMVKAREPAKEKGWLWGGGGWWWGRGGGGHNRTLVCAHVRAGRSENMKDDGAIRIQMTELPALWKFLQKYVNINGSRVFLATDSYQVRNLTRERLGDNLIDTDEPIVHVDRQAWQNDACVGFQAALLEQLILTKCDVLVTSNSGFSWNAALLRGTDDNVFNFSKGYVGIRWLV